MRLYECVFKVPKFEKGDGRKRTGIILVLLIGGLFSLWLYWFPTYSWHQKMTVEVEVDGKVYAGSSVVKMIVKAFREPLELIGRVRELQKQGEAVVVELPDKQYLIALLTYDAYLTGKVFRDLLTGVGSQPEEWASEIRHVRETRDLGDVAYPLLVTFADITDPTSVKEVDPNNLAATFGPGVSLKRITLAITDEPMTKGKIEQVLGWWLAQGVDRRDPPPFRVPNDSPRGWYHIGVTKFIMGKQ